MKNRIYFVIALAFITLLTSCAKEGPTGPQGIQGPGYTGTITGFVSLYDQYGNKVLLNLDSAVLTLSGVTTHTVASTVPAANGLYAFTNEAYTGTYNLLATDSNYATTQFTNFSFLAGTLYKDVKLSVIPDSFLTSFASVHNPGSLYDSLVITAAADPQPRNCIIFMNSNPVVSNSIYVGFLLAFVKPIPANTTSVSLLISKSELNNAGIADSAEVYFAAYSYVVNDYSAYEDQSTGKTVYNAVNTNPIIDSAIAP